MVDTTRFVKIWFNSRTHTEGSPLGSIVNECRLIDHMRLHPNPPNETSLIICKETLTDEQRKYMQKFCGDFHINLVDIEDISAGLPVTGMI